MKNIILPFSIIMLSFLVSCNRSGEYAMLALEESDGYFNSSDKASLDGIKMILLSKEK